MTCEHFKGDTNVMKAKKIFLPLIAVLTVILILTNADRAILYARDAMYLCAEMIVPTLFPFFICSGILIYSGFCEFLSRAFRFCMRPLFNVAEAGSSAFILGIISGYPLGASTACELYKNSYISKTEAERLLSFCNNSGPLFILGSIGVAMYSNIRYGVILYAVHILAALIVGVIFRFYRRRDYTAPKTVMTSPERGAGEVFNIALQTSVRNILTVCGAVIIFSMASRLFLDLIHMSPETDALLSGFLEFATGSVKISNLTAPVMKKLIMTSAIVGFAGISVHIQVIAVIAGYHLSLLPYFLGKVLHAVISVLILTLYFMKFPITTATFIPSMSKTLAASSAAEMTAAAIVTALCIVFSAVYYLRHRNCGKQPAAAENEAT